MILQGNLKTRKNKDGSISVFIPPTKNKNETLNTKTKPNEKNCKHHEINIEHH